MDYDYGLNHDKYILTHSQAIQTHPSFELIGGIDLSRKKRERFEKKFHKPSFSEIDDVKKNADLDLVVVAVPTVAHMDTVKKIMAKLLPKLILIEKPLSFLYEEAKEIIQIGKEKNFSLAVNYIREFEPNHRTLIDKINDEELGFPIKIVCWYSKGIMNNGSHFIQMLSRFMGDINDINIINKGRKWDNFDLEPALNLIYENGQAYLIPVQEENYSLFEMEIIGPKGKVKYYNGGSHYDLWHINTDPVFKGYKKLEAEPITTKTDINKYQYHVYNNIAEYFEGNSDLHCDGKSALRTAQILDQIQQKID